MLPMPPPGIATEVVVGNYNIGSGTIHAKTLLGPKFHTLQARVPRQAIFIHGEGLGCNHTMLERPARWLLARDLFDEIILPDRRGCGGSSVLTRRMTLAEQADDMRRLLDRMNMPGPLTAMGVSYGGPVALSLAAVEARIECAVMVAASPALLPVASLERLLTRTGLLDRLVSRQIRRQVGKLPPREFSFDKGYDAQSPREMSAQFGTALQSIPAERSEFIHLDYITCRDPAYASLPASLGLEIPVLQVIGESDELWDRQVSDDLRRRFPNFHRRVVPGAVLHNDVFFKAEEYYQVLMELLGEACPTVK